MALPTITINAGTGSDTAASGAGPGTALSGANAATVAANNVVTLAVDAPNLSGVSTLGDAVIYVSSSSGRRFSKITAVDNTAKTVTCQDNFANTEGTRGWGIGGKRATFTAALGVDCYEGWTLQWEDTTLAPAATMTVTPTASAADGPLILRGPSLSSRLAITTSANAAIFTISSTGTQTEFRDMTFANSNGTKTLACVVGTGGNNRFKFTNCVIGDQTNTLTNVVRRSAGTAQAAFIDCEVKYLLGDTCTTSASTALISFIGSWSHDNASHGLSGSGACAIIAERSIIEDNGGAGISLPTSSLLRVVSNCTIDGNAGSGIDTSASAAILNDAVIINNNITANVWGIKAAASSQDLSSIIDYNNFGSGAGIANSSGAMENLNAGPHDLNVDPGYVNGGSNNFSVGANVRSLAFPLATRNIGANNSATVNYGDIGAAQHQDSGSGASPRFGLAGAGPSFRGAGV